MGEAGLARQPRTERVVPPGTVFRKTVAGHAALRDRAATELPLKARWTLVMVDGRTPMGVMVARLQGVGIDAPVFALLHAHGLIESVPIGGPSAAPDRPDEAARLRELYAFFCDTIRDLIGLRGTFLQLAVERAVSVDDYRALRDRYLRAAERASGGIVARALAVRLDALLDGGPRS